MIERARRRALEAGLGQVAFRTGEAEDVLADGPFDAAVSRFALMLVQAFGQAIRFYYAWRRAA